MSYHLPADNRNIFTLIVAAVNRRVFSRDTRSAQPRCRYLVVSGRNAALAAVLSLIEQSAPAGCTAHFALEMQSWSLLVQKEPHNKVYKIICTSQTACIPCVCVARGALNQCFCMCNSFTTNCILFASLLNICQMYHQFSD